MENRCHTLAVSHDPKEYGRGSHETLGLAAKVLSSRPFHTVAYEPLPIRLGSESL